MKITKMENDPVKDPQWEKGSQWKKSAPKKRTGPSKDVDKKEGLDWQRTRTSEQRLQQHCLGTVALQEICWYQKTTDLLIQKLPFAHLMQELSQEYHPRTSAQSHIAGKAQLSALCRR